MCKSSIAILTLDAESAQCERLIDILESILGNEPEVICNFDKPCDFSQVLCLVGEKENLSKEYIDYICKLDTNGTAMLPLLTEGVYISGEGIVKLNSILSYVWSKYHVLDGESQNLQDELKIAVGNVNSGYHFGNKAIALRDREVIHKYVPIGEYIMLFSSPVQFSGFGVLCNCSEELALQTLATSQGLILDFFTPPTNTIDLSVLYIMLACLWLIPFFFTVKTRRRYGITLMYIALLVITVIDFVLCLMAMIFSIIAIVTF